MTQKTVPTPAPNSKAKPAWHRYVAILCWLLAVYCLVMAIAMELSAINDPSVDRAAASALFAMFVASTASGSVIWRTHSTYSLLAAFLVVVATVVTLNLPGLPQAPVTAYFLAGIAVMVATVLEIRAEKAVEISEKQELIAAGA